MAKTSRGSADTYNKAVHQVSTLPHYDDTALVQHRRARQDQRGHKRGVTAERRNIREGVVTGDAMFTQGQTTPLVVQDKQGAHLPVRTNHQPTLHRDMQDVHLEAFPRRPRDARKDHG